VKLQLWALICLLSFGSGLGALTWNEATDSFTLNGIGFDLKPYVTVYRNGSDQTLTLTRQVSQLNGSVIMRFTHPTLSLTLAISPEESFGLPMWKIVAQTEYHTDCELHDLWITLDGLEGYYYLDGIDAIRNNDYDLNKKLVPYMDRISQVSNGTRKFWIIGSNYGITRPVESLDKNRIKLLDRNFHSAYLTLIQNRVLDTVPRHAGQRESFQFNLCASRPWLIKANRYPAGRKAAFCISNDADMELPIRLNSVFFGSSDPHSPYWGQGGLAYHGVVVSNTVFGEDYWQMAHTWDDIMGCGNTIGLHTYSTEQDNLTDLKHALGNQLRYFNLRTWVDHSSHINPEALAHWGSIPESPYYIFDILQDEGFDYAWIHELPDVNHFNAFEDISWLPHEVEAFNLYRPIRFFRRTRCEAWESQTQPQYDFKHNVTLTNLVDLIRDEGFCVAYTHLSFRDSNAHRGFYDDLGIELRLRPEADSCFAMLAKLRDASGLWLVSTEELFDRLVATEHVYLRSVDALDNNHLALEWYNGSDLRLKDFGFDFQDKSFEVDLPARTAVRVVIGRELEFGLGQEGMSGNHQQFVCIQRKDRIEIALPERPVDQNTQVRLFNIRGQLVSQASTTYSEGKLYLKLPGCASGIYIVKILDPKGNAQLHKVVVNSAFY
jgi:hypothetical protein